MSQRHDDKLRLCRKCGQEILSTAKGIKKHSKDCKGRPE